MCANVKRLKREYAYIRMQILLLLKKFTGIAQTRRSWDEGEVAVECSSE